jgi:serine protease inhibitor
MEPEQKGMILLPRLKLEYRTELVDTIRALGIRKPFQVGPNLSRIVDGNIQISSIIQQTFLEVDETGAKAGAATVVATSRGISMDPVHLEFNRPFIVAIRHVQTGEVLFVGLISNP